MSPVSRATMTAKADRPAAGRPSLRRAGLGGVALLAGVALAACSSGGSTASSGSSSSSNPLAPSAAKGTVVVGSARFPENELLAEIYVLALQAKGVKVTSKFNIGRARGVLPGGQERRDQHHPRVQRRAAHHVRGHQQHRGDDDRGG